MNESETRAEYIDPMLRASGWGEVDESRVLREFRITDGKIEVGGKRSKPEIADYILVYKNRKIGVVEAKSVDLSATEGVAQAKSYAEKLHIDYTYATNGKEIYEMSIKNGQERNIADFPTPNELWSKTYSDQNEWKERFSAVPIEGDHGKRYYQELAINNALDAVAEEKTRILLTMATGTGKTKVFLGKIAAIGYGKDELEMLQKMIDAEQSDLFDVLNYVSFLKPAISRVERVEQAKEKIFEGLDEKQKEFLDFVLAKYEAKGVEELDEEKLPVLLNLKYHAIANAVSMLGEVDSIRSVFFNFQRSLYARYGTIQSL